MKLRLLAMVAIVILVLTTPSFVSADDPSGATRLTPDGYCVLVSPADPPYVYVDPSRCTTPGSSP